MNMNIYKTTQEYDWQVTWFEHSTFHQALPVCFTEKLHWFTFPPVLWLLFFELYLEVLPHPKMKWYPMTFPSVNIIPSVLFILKTLIYLESAFVYVIKIWDPGFVYHHMVRESSNINMTLLGLGSPIRCDIMRSYIHVVCFWALSYSIGLSGYFYTRIAVTFICLILLQ